MRYTMTILNQSKDYNSNDKQAMTELIEFIAITIKNGFAFTLTSE